MDPGWITALVSVLLLLAGLAAWGLRWAWRIGSRTVRFLDDYFGTPARDGLPARPGVMARLGSMDEVMRSMRVQVDGNTGMVQAISDQVHLNSGHSLRDTVQRTADDMTGVKESLAALEEQVQQIREHQ